MNDYSLTGFLKEKLQHCQSTLKATSYDKENNQYLCTDESLDNVYNFDTYIEKTTSKNEKMPASPDAIHIGSKKLYFIEFKNQSKNAIETTKIKEKFRRGTEVLHDLLSEFKPRDNQYIFCVVFKHDAKSRRSHRDYQNYIESRQTHFGLDELNKELSGFYDHIITQDVEYFRQKYVNLDC
ncbi:Uncharacterised protein [Oligella ureolytica]|uniref:Uncharacterized protein n=1 Tax=Oligella ureolytica TaxID=90244 RepID=A0A378XGT6_9BURK|nr:hypothetical protein [Oligella ureolytica]QPT41164.1 hypothetical protein I6G29_06455 [Oligella ureolytica]SUA53914.1 Uncharacterised protein [Oligella ureolytica]SUA55623.1 Uncharacterised protein [Oligella ureolytica]